MAAKAESISQEWRIPEALWKRIELLLARLPRRLPVRAKHTPYVTAMAHLAKWAHANVSIPRPGAFPEKSAQSWEFWPGSIDACDAGLTPVARARLVVFPTSIFG